MSINKSQRQTLGSYGDGSSKHILKTATINMQLNLKKKKTHFKMRLEN